jgi:hypothetical protein
MQPEQTNFSASPSSMSNNEQWQPIRNLRHEGVPMDRLRNGGLSEAGHGFIVSVEPV